MLALPLCLAVLWRKWGTGLLLLFALVDGGGSTTSCGKVGGSATTATGARDVGIDDWPPLNAEPKAIMGPHMFPRTGVRAGGACPACSSCGPRVCAINETPDSCVPCAGVMGVFCFRT